jgi:raffinose synthase
MIPPSLISLFSSADLLPDPLGVGAFVRFTASQPASRLVFTVGEMKISRFMACRRYDPFWMLPEAGVRLGQTPAETQSLLVEMDDSTCVILIPLVESPLRGALRGSGENGLELVAETGDPQVVVSSMVGLFVAAGENPYTLVAAAARSVAAYLGSVRLRAEKRLHAFVDQFGWCTWDAFYQDVSHDLVRQGLQSFTEGGIQPKFLILDDGWLSVRETAEDERRLSAFAANEKFPGDLAPTVKMAKREFGVETFLVWHAIMGYWAGVDGESLPAYDVHYLPRTYSPDILSYVPDLPNWFGKQVGVPSVSTIHDFYNDYHRHLRQQGVDGVKVDNQSSLEGLAAGSGGRVAMMQTYHEALEGSAQVHFKGNLINCMSCSNDMFYSTLNSSLTRTSGDFSPNWPDSHGRHLYTNAQVGMWFGEFIHPDWDMFQSGHEMGAFHAAGRAVSGGPVYVSDKLDEHNFDVLRKLVLPDGGVLRACRVGRPTRDCLFHDVTKEDVLLKVFNVNTVGSGVIGVFNCRYGEDAGEISGAVSPVDMDSPAFDQTAELYAVYAHNARQLRLLKGVEAWQLTLAPLSFEIFTIVPVVDGFAPIGLPDYYNSGGAVDEWGQVLPNVYTLRVHGSERFLAYSQKSPVSIISNGAMVPFTFEDQSGRLEFLLSAKQIQILAINY